MSAYPTKQLSSNKVSFTHCVQMTSLIWCSERPGSN